MTCADVKGDLDLYVDGELAPERRGAVDAHAARCAGCAREIERRRGLSETLRNAFARSLDGAAPPEGARERAVEGMSRVSRTRLAFPGRLAAAAVVGVTVGLLAYALGLARPTPEERDLAEALRDRDTRDAQIKRLRTEAEADLRFVRASLDPRRRQDAAALAADVAASALARRLDGEAAPPPDPAAARERRVSVAGTVDGASVELTQMGDGRVTLKVPGRVVEASSMAELQRAHAELCRKFSVGGHEGAVRVGDNAAATDLKGRLHLLWRTGGWDEEAQWEAARSWMSGTLPDAAAVESRLREIRERCRAAAAPPPPPEVNVDLGALLAEVKGRGRRELQETRERMGVELKRLERELDELRELRGRARGLRVFAEAVAQP